MLTDSTVKLFGIHPFAKFGENLSWDWKVVGQVKVCDRQDR